MPTVGCAKCGRSFEDNVLCCPHCGESQIPQLSKAQLRVEFMKASRGALAYTYFGLVLGLLAGGAYFGFRLFTGTADFASGLVILLGGMCGSALGMILYLFTHRQRRHKAEAPRGEQT